MYKVNELGWFLQIALCFSKWFILGIYRNDKLDEFGIWLVLKYMEAIRSIIYLTTGHTVGI